MYIRIKIKDLEDGVVNLKTGKVFKDKFKKYGLNFKESDDLMNRFIFEDIGQYRYLLMRLFPLTQEGRTQIGRYGNVTEEEHLGIEDYLKKGNFKLVEEKPERLII